MRISKTILSVAVVTVLACLSAQARSKTLTDFTGKVSSSLVSFDYSFSCMINGSKMTGKGVVKTQDGSFHVNGNGLDIWCDGHTMWTIDTAAEEAMIEPLDESYATLTTNPALLLASLDDAFSEVSFNRTAFSGSSVDASSLKPLQAGKSSSDISQLILYFKAGSSILVGAEAILNDGTVSKFTVSNLKFEQKLKEKEPFRFDEKTLGSSYVVTDLR
jgi:hypothetical protein